MGMSVCPVATIAAPVERAWALLVDPAGYSRWVDGTVESVEPPGPAQAGQTITISTSALGRRWHVTIAIDRVDVARRHIGFRVALPFGVMEHSQMTCTPLDAQACRVRFG
jgi:hypothetical protein